MRLYDVEDVAQNGIVDAGTTHSAPSVKPQPPLPVVRRKSFDDLKV
jgi:hypothetical protein